MKSINFSQPQGPDSSTGQGDYSQLQWLDLTRSQPLELGSQKSLLHDRHRSDLGNSLHPPFFAQTDDYEMVIFRTIDERSEIIEPKTRSIAFVLHGNTVISVRDEDDSTLEALFARLSKPSKKSPGDLLSLFHLLLNEIGDAFLHLREPLTQRTAEWQQRLLDPNDPFNNWLIIMQAKSSLSQLNTNLELQQDALSNWQENTRYEFNPSLQIKFNDIFEHLARVERYADSVRADLDSLTQIYFAANGQKTSVNVQFLAVISAIFLPLNLIAGIFGMNFDNIPLLSHPLGPYVIVSLMVMLAGLLLWWFKKKNWY